MNQREQMELENPNWQRTYIKLLHWEYGGFALYYKRLMEQKLSRTHDAAAQAGMIYSFFTICKKICSKSIPMVKICPAEYHEHQPQKHQRYPSPEL